MLLQNGLLPILSCIFKNKIICLYIALIDLFAVFHSSYQINVRLLNVFSPKVSQKVHIFSTSACRIKKHSSLIHDLARTVWSGCFRFPVEHFELCIRGQDLQTAYFQLNPQKVIENGNSRYV